jgi:hypothetical protein
MNQPDFVEALLTVAARWRGAVERDVELQRALRTIGERLIAWVDGVAAAGQTEAAATDATPAPSAGTTPAVLPPTASAPRQVESEEPSVPAPTAPARPAGPPAEVPLRLGEAPVTVVVRGTPDEVRAAAKAAPPPRTSTTSWQEAVPASASPESDPGMLVRRCELKATACRWAVERRSGLAAGDRAAVFDRDASFFAEAKSLPNCYLWMMDPRGPSLPDDARLEETAGCYEALARAASLLGSVAGGNGDAGTEALISDAMHLLAAAQSALRVALADVSPTLVDADQREAFLWLRREAEDRRIYIGRHMRLDDPAAPEGWAELQARIADVAAAWEGRRQQRRSRQNLLGKARYHSRRVRGADGRWSDDDWSRLRTAIEELVAAGVPASDRELREILLPLRDTLPDEEFGPGLRAVLIEMDRYLATVDSAGAANGEGDRDEADDAAGPDISRVRDLLAGRRVLMIGGERRTHAQAALERAFGLEELIWPNTQAHQSITDFEPAVSRPETALVLLAIRWSSHSFGEVKAMCDRHGKPFVRLPAGYNPDQVAQQILAQCSEALQQAGAVR